MRELINSALDAAAIRVNALIVSGVTAVAGVGTVIEILPKIIGLTASISGILVSWGLFVLAWKKGKLEREQLKLHNDILAKKNAEQAARVAQGLPIRRGGDKNVDD